MSVRPQISLAVRAPSIIITHGRSGDCARVSTLYTGVHKGGGGRRPSPPQWPGKIFFVKIEGLLKPVVLNLSFRMRSNAMFISERRY